MKALETFMSCFTSWVCFILTAQGYIYSCLQLKVMAPCIMAAAFIGISFGSLSAIGIYGAPSLSPSLSSIAIILAVAVQVLRYGKDTSSYQNLMTGGLLIAMATTIGAFSQWAMQACMQVRAGYGLLCMRWANPLEAEDVREVFAVMIPAVFASSMLQIATYTDLYFASYIPGAAACLGYANLLIMAPLGIASSSLLIPMLQVFSRFSKPSLWSDLRKFVKQGLILSMMVTLSMTAVIMSLAQPIVRILFQRFAFSSSATEIVSSLLKIHALGSSFYLARDLLVQVFYALGDGNSPFLISMAAISANALLDWLFVRQAGLGVEGLVLATMLVNILSVGALFQLLFLKIGGVTRLKHWIEPAIVLVISCLVASRVTSFAFNFWKFLLSLIISSQGRHISGTRYWIIELFSVILSAIVGIVSFFLPLRWLKNADIESTLRML
ncbi:hypothetical protein O6H91_12G024200 [Diphasiastrum complanatum]|uniref:Uncharacterized protein n=1 Tax=Diphasiastrum complanatum TaxID=34168 RepID=A0ACC2BZP7_DIPCM|nr:hypothetical protein O6H91_12G024200 [Diphasiastrum complanatum]